MTVIVAFGLASGLSTLTSAAILATIVQPWLAVVGSAAALAARRSTRSAGESATLAAIAGEVRAGRSLRQALGGPATTRSDHALRRVGRLAALGTPLSELVPLLRHALPQSAPLVVPAIGMLEASGGRAAAVFELLAESHAIREGIEAEKRAALAPARLSAVILSVLTVAGVAWLTGGGRLTLLLADPIGGLLGLVGLAFVGAGAAGFAMVLRHGAAR